MRENSISIDAEKELVDNIYLWMLRIIIKN